MDRAFDTRPDASGADQRRGDAPGPTLLGEVLAHWPTAPVSAVGQTDRWLTFERPGGGTVYLERYAWDDRSVPHYLVVTPAGPDRAEQRRCPTIGEAVETVRRLLVSRPAPRKRGLLDLIEGLADGGRSLAAPLPA